MSLTLGLKKSKMSRHKERSLAAGLRQLPSLPNVFVIALWFVSIASDTRGLDVPDYYGIYYPSAKQPPILERFVIKDGKLVLRSAMVDTDNDFVLDSIIFFFEETEPKLSSIAPDEGDPFWDGTPLGIKVPPKALFNQEVRLDVGGVEYRIDFVGRNYPKPEHPSNSKWRSSRIYKKFVGEEPQTKAQLEGGDQSVNVSEAEGGQEP